MCVKGVYMGKRGMETQKEKGLKNMINERKKQENKIMLVWRVCVCLCKFQALEEVCDLKKKKKNK